MRCGDCGAEIFEGLPARIETKSFEGLRERSCGHGAQQCCAPTYFAAKLFADGADEIGEEAVASGFDAGVVLDEGEAEDVEIESHGGAATFEIGERIAREEQFRLHAAIDANTAAFGATDELIAHS